MPARAFNFRQYKMEGIVENPSLPEDNLTLELKKIIPIWNTLDYNKKVFYRKLYFMHKFEKHIFGESDISQSLIGENDSR